MSSAEANAFLNNICDLSSMEKLALSAFYGKNMGELFVEYREDESIKMENGLVQTPHFSFKRGFGIRSFREDASRYSYSSALNEKALKKALDVVKSGNCNANMEIKSGANNLYDHRYFLDAVNWESKIKFLQEIDAYARQKSP
ncbi:MAG: hypothetical protein LBO02_01765, partial [Holosporaceae bacterium]|nr:hypothetical protein [Holosporaceae bacterium]